MASPFKAGLAYFATVFGIGVVLGILRNLVLIPTFGELMAVLIELPVILAAAWSICRGLVRAFEVPLLMKARFAMGGIGFALLMLAELGLSTLAFGSSISDHFDSYRSAHPGKQGRRTRDSAYFVLGRLAERTRDPAPIAYLVR